MSLRPFQFVTPIIAAKHEYIAINAIRKIAAGNTRTFRKLRFALMQDISHDMESMRTVSSDNRPNSPSGLRLNPQ